MRIFAVLAVLLAAPTAHAGLEISVDAPASVEVYDTVRYRVTVENPTGRKAKNVTLTIALPETNSSPDVYILGNLGALHRRCAQQDTAIECDLGSIRNRRSKTVWFEIALPVAAVPLEFDLAATSTSADTGLATFRPALTYIDTPVAAPRAAHVEHCTGQGLRSFFVCTLFPSSISSHDIVLEADGSVRFVPAQPGYTGAWQQPRPDTLYMTYSSNGQIVMAFRGQGAGNDCFEGIAVFPGSQWNAGYEVCLQ